MDNKKRQKRNDQTMSRDKVRTKDVLAKEKKPVPLVNCSTENTFSSGLQESGNLEITVETGNGERPNKELG